MSEDKNDAAESPTMSDEEREQLEALKAKEAEEAAAKAEEEAAAAAEADAKRRDEIANRPMLHVLVRHMARSPRTRTMRAARAGHRRQGVILDNGLRLRRKGRGRFTELDLRDFAENHERLLEYVRVGSLEVCDPRSERIIPYDSLCELLEEVGQWVAQTNAEAPLRRYHVAMKAWEEAMERAQEVVENAEGEEAEEAAAAFLESVKEQRPEEPELEEPEKFELRESGLQQDLVDGSNDMNAAPGGDSESDLGEEEEDDGDEGGGDPTTENQTLSQETASEDQKLAEATGQANPPPSESADTAVDPPKEEGDDEGEDPEGEEPKEITEKEMLGMKLDELKTLAKEEFEIDPEKVDPCRAKKEVVALIFEASKEGEE